MKILNLYCGIGGNRKLWKDVEVTAVENNEEIAKMYQEFFPEDKVIVGDAHQYLLEHYKEFDFIWSSPPCPTHSRVRKQLAFRKGKNGERYEQNKPVFPDMKLYEEIIFLDNYFDGKWVVENVIPFYEPLIEPLKLGRHYIWANFDIPAIKVEGGTHKAKISEMAKHKGFDISKIKCKHRKDTILRNCVEEEIGLHILQCAKLNSTELAIPPRPKVLGILANFI
jgi:DNA (cytosine-5)-methyltransferase 1